MKFLCPLPNLGENMRGVYKSLTEAGWWKEDSSGGSGRQRPGTTWGGRVSWLGPMEDILPTALQSKVQP